MRKHRIKASTAFRIMRLLALYGIVMTVAIHRVLLQQILRLDLHIAAIEELRDTTLVGVGSDGVVRNADSHPDGTSLFLRAVWAATHHLEHPGLILISHREGLTLRAIAELLHERGHHLQCLTGRLGTLEGDIDQ